MTNVTDINTLLLNFVLISSKLVDILKNADLSGNFYNATLLNSHSCMGDFEFTLL